jgi:hypothetical protein
MKRLTHNCAGMPRRDFLQLGIGGALGLGFADLLRLRARATEPARVASAFKPSGRQVNCIMIWLDGPETSGCSSHERSTSLFRNSEILSGNERSCASASRITVAL